MNEKCFHYKDGQILDQIKSMIWGFISLFAEDPSRMVHDAKSIGN
jgi:hypothetical protein